MDLLIKAESEKHAKKEYEKRRKLRLLQVRKQTTDWMVNTRRQYATKKSDQLQNIVDETASKREKEFKEAIKEMTNEHVNGMQQIGSAHRAAELINHMNLPQKEHVEKIKRHKTAFKRHVGALKSKRDIDAKEIEVKQQARKLKEEVRQKEDIIAKELVLTRAFQVPVITSSGKEDGKSEKIYPTSPVKYLNVPTAQKSPKKKRKSKRNVSKENKKPEIQKDNTSPSSVFEMVATEIAAGSTPPIIKELPASSKESTKITTVQEDGKSGMEPVTYFDASIPLPPIRYMAPAGLVQPISRQSVTSNAWLEGEKLNKEAQRIEEKRLADLREMERRAHIRGQKALRIAKLEQRYKQLEADLLEKNQMQGFQPVLDSSNRNSLLGLEDPEVPEDEQQPHIKTHPDDELDTHVKFLPAKRGRPLKQKQKSPFTTSAPVPQPQKIDSIALINGSTSSSWANSLHTLSTLSSSDAQDIHNFESEDESTSTMALLEIAYPEGRKSSHTLLPVTDSTESSLSDVLAGICMQQQKRRQSSQQSPLNTGRKNGHLKRQASSYTTTPGETDHLQLSVPTNGTSGSPSSWSTSFCTLSSLETSEITSSELKEETSSSSTSTMAVLKVRCSPGRDSRYLQYLLHSTTDSSLSDALNNLCFQQETLHWSSTISTSTSTNCSKEEKPERPLSLGSSGSASHDTSSLIRVTKKMVKLLEKENETPAFEAPTSCSSIKLNTSSSSSSKSKETNRGTFGTDLGNTLLSSTAQSEQRTTTLPLPLPAPASSAIQKLTNEWTNVSIEKPPWWQT